MLHKEIIGLTFLAFILWIFIGSPQERLSRTCAPIGWVGNVSVSVAALVVPTYQSPTQNLFNKVTYGCEYTVWRLFYQGDYNKYLESQGLLPKQPANLESTPKMGLPSNSAASTSIGTK